MDLTFNTTKVYQEVLYAWDLGMRRILLEGGTSSSKTYSIIQSLILIAKFSPDPLIISVVSESLPHLKKGAIRDFFMILREPMKPNKNYNATDCIYTFDNGSIIEFFGAGEAGKVHGPRRHILFINEANNVPWITADALDYRTIRFTIADWNPVDEFWAHERWLKDKAHNLYSHSTYLDARHVLPQAIVDKIEEHRGDPNWWNVYGLGLVGKIEGLVYPSFTQVPKLPVGNIFYGMDFGYTNHPTTLIRNVIIGNDLYSQQLIYATGMTNQDIAQAFLTHGLVPNYDEIWADSAEPKSIDEIAMYGYNIKGAPKGPGSVNQRIQRTNQYTQHWTEDSIEAIKEQRNCRYIKDKDDKFTNKITHDWTHCMDARDYAVVGLLTPVEHEQVLEYYEPVAISPV